MVVSSRSQLDPAHAPKQVTGAVATECDRIGCWKVWGVSLHVSSLHSRPCYFSCSMMGFLCLLCTESQSQIK